MSAVDLIDTAQMKLSDALYNLQLNGASPEYITDITYIIELCNELLDSLE